MTPTQKKRVRENMADFCARAEAHELAWHYTQARPFRGFGAAPEREHANDCSGYVSLVYNFAMHAAGVYLADPLGYKYAGWGWTGSLLAWLSLNGTHAPRDKYLVGDVILYGSSPAVTKHTVICSRPGTLTTARWSSLGQEAGPMTVKAEYRRDLLSIWRHPGLA